MRFKPFILFLQILFLISCKKFEFSPYETNTEDLPSDLNNQNITRLHSSPITTDDTIRIFFSGDTQRFYDELEDMVNKANSITNLDFIVIAGDITDFGLEKEFSWICERLGKFNRPYICVIGNHDYNANGTKLYADIFGERNFSFVYKNYKFLCHDTNCRENYFNGTVPNLNWLQNQLNDSSSLYYAGISHIPPYDADFDSTLTHPYKNLFASNPHMTVSMHGHRHTTFDSYFYGDQVRYIVTDAVGNREAFLLKLCRNSVIKESIYF